MMDDDGENEANTLTNTVNDAKSLKSKNRRTNIEAGRAIKNKQSILFKRGSILVLQNFTRKN